MTRRTVREIAAHLIYAMDCTGDSAGEVVDTRMAESYYACLAEENDVYEEKPNRKQLSYIRGCVSGVAEHRAELDAQIERLAIGWRVSRIAKLTKAILELAMYEILYVEDVPTAVAINEAVELTKKYEDAEVAAFVNGVLGAFVRTQEEKTATEQEPEEAVQGETAEPEADI